jgi:hypothetical protein
MNIEMINKIIIVGCDTRWMKMMGGYDFKRERGPRGILIMGINPTHFPKIIIIVYNLIFTVECFQSQPLNSCKRVCVRRHIPYLLGEWD